MAWLLVSFHSLPTILYRHQSNFETILWINLFDYNYRRVHKGLRIATKESTEKKRLKRNGFDQTNFGMAFFYLWFRYRQPIEKGSIWVLRFFFTASNRVLVTVGQVTLLTFLAAPFAAVLASWKISSRTFNYRTVPQ